MTYHLLKQVSILNRKKTVYFYNWLNDIGVSIEKKYILHTNISGNRQNITTATPG